MLFTFLLCHILVTVQFLDDDSVHAYDTDGDDSNDCNDKEYDGSSKDYNVVF